ncbi:hypothetical protein LCGC14_1867780 [marine sediment metagenome]|uniref:Uncharacterized protein n=1 Tax=marine sediment metagenome TaxID=412755 RepID=A0A0F9IJY4_9ZZZZ
MLRNPEVDPDRLRQRRASAKKESKETIDREQAEAQKIDEDRRQKIKDLLDNPLASALFEELEIQWGNEWQAFRHTNSQGDEFRYRQGRLDSIEKILGFLCDLVGRKVELKITRESK